jgi:hypothetical protein
LASNWPQILCDRSDSFPTIRFGVLLTLVAVVCGALSGWVILPIPHMLAVKWIVSESLLSVVFGLAVAGICKPSAGEGRGPSY